MTIVYSTFLADEYATIRFAADMAIILEKGDLITLEGDLGAGKSTFARAIIRALANDDDLDVPSPTFTLVQQYDDLRLSATHADLYRIGSADEIYELGLIDALEAGIVLIEWPQQAAMLLPEANFAITLTHHNDGRLIRIEAPEKAYKRLERTLEIREFLQENGRGRASRHYLAGDASPRRYEIINEGGNCEIVMNAERSEIALKTANDYATNAHLATNLATFIAVDRLLCEHGFLAPEIRAVDLQKRVAILQDLGQERIYDQNHQPIIDRYQTSMELLADFHQENWPQYKKWDDIELTLLPYDWQVITTELSLVLDWYLPYKTESLLSETKRNGFYATWQKFLPIIEQSETSLVMRDYHAPNILWQNAGEGHRHIGLIDFQDALMGPIAYDVVSLTQDARITMNKTVEKALRDHYIKARQNRDRSFDLENFLLTYALMGVQRASKILGIFVRLDQRDGKPEYLGFLARIEDYLRRNLEHPQLAMLKTCYQDCGLLDG